MVALAAVYPRFRAWAGPLPAIAAVLSVPLVPISTESGEKLDHRLGYTKDTCAGIHDAIEEHEELAEWLIWLVLVLAILAVVSYFLHRSGTASKATSTVLAVLTVLSAATVVVQVIRIGHAGAEAVWKATC